MDTKSIVGKIAKDYVDEIQKYTSIKDANGNIVSVALEALDLIFVEQLKQGKRIKVNSFLRFNLKEIKALQRLYFSLGGRDPMSLEEIQGLIAERKHENGS